ncbi:MAG TPA: rRNA maturation RNase YbeY [Cyclobacteriaceae bacterium]|nr:rRNA maturation RNase YbeY [Cyclobacteriaceae bacterium]
MARIEFLSQLPSFKVSNPRKTAAWLKNICFHEGRQVGSLSYVFCSDRYLQSMNQDFLDHSSFTDILSFDLSEDNNISGEIYISVDRVRANAKKYAQPFDTELRRVMAHGILHFVGYKDKTSAEKAQMRSKEEACLSLWK